MHTWPLVEEASPGSDRGCLLRGCLLKVHVIEYHEGRVTAELEMYPLEVLPTQCSDRTTGTSGPGESDDAHRRIDNERLAHLGATGQHVQQGLG
jgi:hypothetical protein